MSGLILLPLECRQFMMWAQVWPAFTIGQYHDEVCGMGWIDAIQHINRRAKEN